VPELAAALPTHIPGADARARPAPRRPAGPAPDAPLRIALLAPPWIPVPPPGYGGIELVLAELAGALVRAGHDVTLLAAPGSTSDARVVVLLDHAHPEAIGETMHEADNVGAAFDVVAAAAAEGRPFDLLHDHSGFSLFAVADRIGVPVLQTLHGPFTDPVRAFYRRHARKAAVSALSRAQMAGGPPELRWAGVIPNPLDVAGWPFRHDKGDHLLWIGRMTPEKGPHRAIAAARAAGRRLVLAGPIQAGQERFFAEEVEPQVDGDAVCYLDVVGGEAKQELFAASAAMLMPIRWPEPFGMVMIEAMACGTPVIAFPEGAAADVVIDGHCGYLVPDEAAMVQAIGRLDRIDPAACRDAVAARYDADVVATAYEATYRQVVGEQRPLRDDQVRSASL
jgi:glycosyltransferase involved in cell wall biosynthesis